MKKSTLTLVVLSSILGGCSIAPKLPESPGEIKSGYNYVPVDPIPINIPSSCKTKDFLKVLPDQAVRIAVGQYDVNGSLTFGPSKIGTQGQSYQVILDYIAFDSTSKQLYVERNVTTPGAQRYQVSVFDTSVTEKTISKVFTKPYSLEINLDRVQFPVYLGVGLRLTASISIKRGSANLASLGAIAAEAEAGNLVGTLVVQTLGVSGKSVSTIIPMPSELNQSTVQNAILALGQIKAILYNENDTIITPRIVGFYNPIGGGQDVVNGVISGLSSDPIEWCK
ncbi:MULTISPECIES: hypothetical protein [unclassified Methylophilus]|uniref:hypothetical protein n=1 Tax=unclassified Methylophilus TaxID=2630143 RepID=UPI0003704751|nr:MULTISPECIES: hypothetical protein [unclassified Methylophilus]